MSFFDLPGSEIMSEDPETIRVRQGNSLNKSIISFCSVMKELSYKKNDYILYENSMLTHLMKDCLGGNCLTVGIYCI